MGSGQGSTEQQGDRTFFRRTAKTLYRPSAAGQADRIADGRTLFGAGSEGTEAVEELIWDLRGEYTILIVTHNMAQARRASEECIFMLMGKVVEHTETETMFVTPEHKETADYIEGRYG